MNFSIVIAGLLGLGSGLAIGGGGGQYPFDGREVHWICYGRWIARNIRSDGINRLIKWNCVSSNS
jgi:hypothetical protein